MKQEHKEVNGRRANTNKKVKKISDNALRGK